MPTATYRRLTCVNYQSKAVEVTVDTTDLPFSKCMAMAECLVHAKLLHQITTEHIDRFEGLYRQAFNEPLSDFIAENKIRVVEKLGQLPEKN